VRISEYIKDSQYGVSEAMEEQGSHAVLRMNSITTSGWLDLSDLKYINMSKKDADTTTLQNGDILFNRTNSKELVGKCAIWRDTKIPFSFASYLIRLRLKEGMLPEYLWATLNSTYGKYRLLNAAKQAVSMANVSPTDLGRITVPLPPPSLQESFARLVRQVEALRTEMLEKVEAFNELQSLVTQQALLGDLTKNWREKNQEEIANAAAERDVILGTSKAKFSVRSTETAPPERPTDFRRDARLWLRRELSELQSEVWSMLQYEWKGSVIVDDPAIFADFCTSPQTAWRMERFKVSPSHIRRTLEQLAALGLIAKISLPKTHLLTQQTEYMTAFRPLREEENTRLADADLLRRELRRDAAEGNS
jgi:type I restriction enzyme S subunit